MVPTHVPSPTTEAALTAAMAEVDAFARDKIKERVYWRYFIATADDQRTPAPHSPPPIDDRADDGPMIKTILIHGYAAGLEASVFRKPFGEHSGFIALDAEVNSGIAKSFRWSKNISLSIAQCTNPFQYFQLYRDEELLAESPIVQSTLREFINHADATTIICHSLGCRLMIGAMNAHGIPESITKIIFLQGDVSLSKSITNSAVRDRIINGTLIIKNYFCPWDQSLLSSAIIHRTNRIGLTGWNEIGVKNVFYPLLKPMNLHTSPLRDRGFLRKHVGE